MLKKIISVIVALSISTISTGCASMFTGTTSNINVTSTPTGADCDVTGHGVHTPGNIVLEKSSSDLTITCQKEGFEDGSSKIISSFNTTTTFIMNNPCTLFRLHIVVFTNFHQTFNYIIKAIYIIIINN